MLRNKNLNFGPFVNNPGIHPDAPAGGGGAGSFRGHSTPGILGRDAPTLYAQAHGPLSIPGQVTGQPLVLYSPEFKRSEIKELSILKNHIQGNQAKADSRIVAISTWKSLASTIRSMSPISQLVLHFHGGTDGTMKVGYKGKEVGSSQVKKLFLTRCQAASCKAEAVIGSRFCLQHKPAKTEQWFGPRVERILFESCVVGCKPNQLVSFARLFHASNVSGYTWFHATGSYEVTFPKGTKAQEIRTIKNKFRKYLVKDIPNDAMIAQRCASSQQKISFALEWWRKEDNSTLPPEIAKSQENPQHFRVFKELKQRNIKSNQTNSLAHEYENQLLGSNGEQVNVTIQY